MNIINKYSADEITGANHRIAAYNMAQQQFEEDVLLLLLLKERKKRKAVHAMYKQRSREGALNILIDRYLMDDDTKFREYFRLSRHLFESVLEIIENDLKGIPTTWIREPMTPRLKFCITMR